MGRNGTKISSGITWGFVNQGATQVVQIASMAILARLLSPADYGIAGIISTLTAFASIFVDLGMSPAIIQRKEPTQDDLSSAFWFNTTMGLAIFLLVLASSGIIAHFYNEPSLRKLIPVSSLVFIISPLASVHSALMTKALQFKKLALLGSFNLLFTAGVSIALAFAGCGVWSLVAQPIAAAIFNLVAFRIALHWSPSLVFP